MNLQALPQEEADPALALICPVLALQQFEDRTQSFRTSEQLFVCYGGQQKGKSFSKQRMAHWIVDATTLAYEAQDTWPMKHLLEPGFCPADHVLPSLMMQPEPSQRLPCAIGTYGGYLT